MTEAQLWQFFKDAGVTRQEIAAATGLKLGYIYNLLNGSDPLTPSAKFKIMMAYPATQAFLLPAAEDAEQELAE